mmetsp:Transcript_16218/g.21852  ORF Transcript_16218/g.21852 Transcript_16218/m.21852 type:complete len:432 (-) Transcript_16218:305-1600(-)|eukprot:CAMPEP_0185767140 /NCGR_PEP_ID=MMETSP1174-20130828/41772_1 /TAXON_ID=35687 /ORGANISM="Dictyocha speculum, Strain CCMP1381" /LENGTH=431 /DNA_ID=CAMNT_0028451197 /DNA_START=11 /DNA_END=1306 /DNA_ORIENTATION=-
MQQNNFAGLVDCLFFPENVFEDSNPTSSPQAKPFFTSAQGMAQDASMPGPLKKKQCLGATRGVVSSSDSEGTGSYAEEGDKEESRRERNRRHARVNRLRKKEYMQSLETQLEKLAAQNASLEKQISEKKLGENTKHALWFGKLQGALALRASAEPDHSKWYKFVDEEIVLVHPITPYRSYHSADVISNRCVLMGIQDVIDDSESLLVALAGLCNKGMHAANRSEKVQLRFNIEEQSMHYREEGIMCPFEMRSTNLMPLGLKEEVTKRGCLRVIFNSSNMIKQLELHFDPIAFWRQLQMASGSKEVLLAPNTLQVALRHSNEPRVITEATRPFRITHVNDAWTNLCGYTSEEACGKTLGMLQGEMTDAETVAKLVSDCELGRATSMNVTNYDKQGLKFDNFLTILPLSSSPNGTGDVSHLLGVLKPTCEKFA